MKIYILLLPFLLFANVEEKIKSFYKSHYPNIRITSVKANKPFPKKYSHISFKLANYKMPSSTVIIDKKYYYYTINAKIDVYKANEVIRKNQFVKPHVSLQTVKFRSFYSPPLAKIDDNLIASKIISKNSVINRSNTKIKPLVIKGENVNVIFKDDSIEIYSKGKALNDANKGDNINVRIKNKTYAGTVDSNGNVIIK